MKPTVERVRELLDYQSDTGHFYWKVDRGGPARRGVRAGSDAGGYWRYRKICIDGRSITESHVAWVWMTGEWPTTQIDHINRDGKDGRWCNLREATQAQQEGNKSTRCDNESGYRGVSLDKRRGKWRAFIRTPSGRNASLGSFATAEAASSAYEAAALLQFGEFFHPGK